VAFFKGLIPGVILTFVVCLIMGSNGSQGDWLHIHRVALQGYNWYWSWPLFFLSTGGASGIFWMME
jgi:hypothetical protein